MKANPNITFEIGVLRGKVDTLKIAIATLKEDLFEYDAYVQITTLIDHFIYAMTHTVDDMNAKGVENTDMFHFKRTMNDLKNYLIDYLKDHHSDTGHVRMYTAMRNTVIQIVKVHEVLQ